MKAIQYREILDAIVRNDLEGLRRSFDRLITRPQEIEKAAPGQLGPALEGVSRGLLGDFTKMPDETRAAIASQPRSNMSHEDYHAGAAAVIRSLPAWVARVERLDDGQNLH